MEAITIIIRAASEGGYLFDIYDHQHVDCPMTCEESGSTDGGLCTTTMLNALGMAASQAGGLIKKELGHECPGCGSNMLAPGVGRILSRFIQPGVPKHYHVCRECDGREGEEGDFIEAR